MKKYLPKGFPLLVMRYLQDHGESRACDIRREIGLDVHCKSTPYKNRSNYTLLSNIIPRLMKKKMVKRTKRGFYALTKPFLLCWDEIEVDGHKITLVEDLNETREGLIALGALNGVLCGVIWERESKKFRLLSKSELNWHYEESYLLKTQIKNDLL